MPLLGISHVLFAQFKETEDTGIKKRPVCIVTTYTGLQVKVKVKKIKRAIYKLGFALISFSGIAYR